MHGAELTLVLCVKNGGSRLKNCLRSIANLEWEGDLQIILVDNNSTDDTYGVMQAFAQDSRRGVDVMEVSIPGNGAGRNAAISKARGDIILFIDGDCYPEPEFVREWHKVFQLDGDLGYGSGKILKFLPGQSMIGCRDTEAVELLKPDQFVPRGLIQGSNMAFRASCLAAAGPFDPRFGAGAEFAGEEWEVALRASKKGWSGGYFPGPTVLHDHGRAPGDDEIRHTRFYDYGAGAVYAKASRTWGLLTVLRKALGEIWRSRDAGPLMAFVQGAAAYVLRPDRGQPS